MPKLKKRFAALVAPVIGCVIGIALTACGGGLTLGVAGIQSPNITSQPANQSVAVGQSATFSVAATGSATLGYQWKKNGSNIDGATSSSYTTPATSSADNGTRYSVSVSNSTGSVTSGEASLTVFAAPIPQPPTPQPAIITPHPAIITPHPAIIQPAIITTQPTSQSVVAGQRATFTVKAASDGTLDYQWKKNGINIAGATSSTYTTPAIDIGDNGAVFTVVVGNSAGTVTSSNATLTVTAAAVVGTQPSRYSLVANASGGFYDKTECVKDNSTGLVWEGKTASPATSRLGTSTYTNYDSTASAQKWNGNAYVNPTQAEVDASTNSIGYQNSVNASALCAYTDWRLPTKEELDGIVLRGTSPKIDATWFPNTQASFYWSSSPDVGYPNSALLVSFLDGIAVNFYYREGRDHVRLVR